MIPSSKQQAFALKIRRFSSSRQMRRVAGVSVVRHHAREFDRVPGLTVEDWATSL